MICKPEPTSLMDRASSVYPSVEKYLNHLKTGGIWDRFTKNLVQQLRGRVSFCDAFTMYGLRRMTYPA